MKFATKSVLFFLVLIHSMGYTQIILRFQSHIDTQATLLGDVLVLKNDERHWADLPLQSHPKAGEFITKESIIEWMKHHLGNFHYEWQGKTQTQVTALRHTQASLLLEKAQAALMKELGSHYTRVAVTPISKLNNSEYPLDSFKTEVRISFPVAKRVCVWLIHNTVRIPVWFRVTAYAKVLVAKRNLPYHTPIHSSSFFWDERNIAGLKDQPTHDFPENFWLKSSLARDKILLTHQIKEPPLVVQGQIIQVTVHNHRVTVVMDAIALADGYLDQTISVKNPLNHKTFTARVSGVQNAEATS